MSARFIQFAGLAVVLVAAPVGVLAEEVVVYTALDRGFSESLLADFERTTGITVRSVFDTESTKTVGLVNRIRAERGRPRCDVFWNNEIVNTVRLKSEGLLQAVRPAGAEHYPVAFRDPDGYWHGFAARARVLIVNNDLVPAGAEPTTLAALTDPVWKGRVGIAKPLFGTTASHVACLYAVWGEARTTAWLQGLQANDVQVLAGNKQCARAVAAGELACALTDTDDAIIEIEAGRPVRMVYLDCGSGEMGTLFIPNTLAVVKDCPHPEAARRLIEYLLQPEIEARLAAGPSAQIPLNTTFTGGTRVLTPRDVPAMAVDIEAAAAEFPRAARFVQEQFLK